MAAAELALGLLEGDDLRQAEMRRRTDPAFAAEVVSWERHFELLFRSWPEVDPPSSAQEMLARVIGRHPANDNSARGWKIATFLSGAAAAVLAVFLILPKDGPPAMAPVAEGQTLMATTLTGQDGLTKLPVVIDVSKRQLRMAAGLDIPARRSAQLWLIVGSATPAPIGILKRSDGGLSAKLDISGAIPADATLAISIEPAGGSPTGMPTGPVVASGTLTRI